VLLCSSLPLSLLLLPYGFFAAHSVLYALKTSQVLSHATLAMRFGAASCSLPTSLRGQDAAAIWSAGRTAESGTSRDASCSATLSSAAMHLLLRTSLSAHLPHARQHRLHSTRASRSSQHPKRARTRQLGQRHSACRSTQPRASVAPRVQPHFSFEEFLGPADLAGGGRCSSPTGRCTYRRSCTCAAQPGGRRARRVGGAQQCARRRRTARREAARTVVRRGPAAAQPVASQAQRLMVLRLRPSQN
jgi:hypothetical protein